MTFTPNFKRLRLAFRYLFGRLTDEQAFLIIADCRQTAGWHPLLVLERGDVLNEARETFVDNPHLRRLTARACRQVEHNCVGRWKEHDRASAWAVRLVQDYAKEEGIILTRWDNVMGVAPKNASPKNASPQPTRVRLPLSQAFPNYSPVRQEAA